MSRYASRQELANKIDYEGGLCEAAFGYGIDADDMPEGDTELFEAWKRLDACRPVIDAVSKLLPDPGPDDGE